VSLSGVAVGSSIGHAIGGFFGGGSSTSAPMDASPQASAAPTPQNFTKCMDDNGGNMQICNWYLEQLKACQAAASQY
jgi:hypothetical protein